jgi:competence protein ComEC
MQILSLIYSVILSFSAVAGSSDIDKIDLNLERNEIAFTFFELPNGEATLVQNGLGETVLINTGGPNTKEDLEEKLSIYNVESIHSVIITNIGADYCANLDWVVTEYNVKNVFVATSIKETVINAYSLSTVNVTGWEMSSLANVMDGVKVEVIHAEETEEFEIGSLALLITFGEQKLLYMGLANEMVENDLIQKFELEAEILKVGDFASEHGTSQSFIDEVDPQVAVIFRASDRDPSTDVLDRLQETWIDTYLTMQTGSISIKCSKDNYKIITIPKQNQEEKLN